MKTTKWNKPFFTVGLAAILLLLLTGQTLAQPEGIFVATGSMTTRRFDHTATLLGNGKVLLVGGQYTYNCCNFLASAELYDPVSGTFSATGSMSTVRVGHAATLLNNGKVLIAGGGTTSWPYGPLATAELYDPDTGTFALTAGSMTTARSIHAAVLLQDGRVLLVGGQACSLPGCGLASAEIYDPASGTFTPTGGMSGVRQNPTATLLANGKVLIAGGDNEGPYLASAELYDPVSGTFTLTSSMSTPRNQRTTTLLNSGQVLMVGGHNGSSPIASAEFYDPVSGVFTLTGSMSTPRIQHSATLLDSGEVLITGGYNGSATVASAELYDPISGTFTPIGSMSTPRALHRTILLGNGAVLVAGGYDSGTSSILSSAELYVPANQTCVSPPSGLVSWWDADSVTGNTAVDIADGNNGTMMNGAATAPGFVGQAFSFNGLNGVVRISDATNLHFTNQMTVEAWINKKGSSRHPFGEGGRIVDKVTAGWPDGWLFDNHPSDGKLRFSIGPVDVMSSTVLPLNTWIHVAGVYDGSTLSVYMNGMLAGTTSTNVPIPTNSLPLRIGADSTEYLEVFNGLIDEVAIYSRALSAAEIQSIFIAGNAGKCENSAPVATCKNVAVSAGLSCTASASIDNGSYDPDGDPITLIQSPAGPYSLGATSVTLTVTDDKGASGTCTGMVTVVDTVSPIINISACPGEVYLGATASVTVDVSDCSGVASQSAPNGPNLLDTSTVGTKTFTVTAVDNAGNTNSASCTYKVIYVPFAAFEVKVEIDEDDLEVKGRFTLSTGSDGIDPVTEEVTLQLTGGTGSFATTISAGSFKFTPAKVNKRGKVVSPSQFKFEGVVDGVELEVKITDLGSGNFELKADGEGANLVGFANPLTVTLTIGNDSGSTMIEAEFD